MYILESFDKELYERDLKEDAYEEGKAAGLKAGYVTSVDNIMKNLKVSAEKACEILGISMEVYIEALENEE